MLRGLRRALPPAVSESALLVEEFWVPCTRERADLAAVGEELWAFEIKSARDSLRRLPRQTAAYGRLFDRCALIVADGHVAAAREIVPDWWGLAVMDDPDEGPSWQRPALANFTIDPELVVRLLWREEAAAAIIGLGQAIPPRCSRIAMWSYLVRELEVEALCRTVREALRRRDPAQAKIPTKRFRTAPAAAR